MAKKNNDAALMADPAIAEAIEEAKKAKKAKKARVKYTVPEGGLKAWPKDFDRKVYKPLLRKDFADETVYMEAKATRLEAAAKRIREEVTIIRQVGGVEQRKAAKQLARLQNRMATMQEALGAQGIDVAALLAGLIKK